VTRPNKTEEGWKQTPMTGRTKKLSKKETAATARGKMRQGSGEKTSKDFDKTSRAHDGAYVGGRKKSWTTGRQELRK